MTTNSTPPKPRTEFIHPELVRLPQLTVSRRIFRKLFGLISRLLVLLFTRVEIIGRENIPNCGPMLVVTNHLGDADGIIGVGLSQVPAEFVAKIELHEVPVFGALLQAYGVIWIHRGQADRRAIRVILEALSQGRIVALAPEGRESLTGALEEGTGGAAYLALKANVPILPITLRGTRNQQIISNLKRFRRSKITITVGPAFPLPNEGDFRSAVKHGTRIIMQTLANQLPIEYQGVFKSERSN